MRFHLWKRSVRIMHRMSEEPRRERLPLNRVREMAAIHSDFRANGAFIFIILFYRFIFISAVYIRNDGRQLRLAVGRLGCIAEDSISMHSILYILF